MIKLSVIIPVYNVEDYLKECFDSLLSQSFQDFELIIVDDGSTDNSFTICKEYAAIDNRVVVVHKENGGVSSARNVALKLVRGEYITFVDPDDFISSETYSDNMNYLFIHNDVDCIQFPYCHYRSDIDMEIHKLPAKLIEGRHDLFQNWWAGSVISFSLCHKIFKKKIFNGIIFREGHVSEDTLLIPQLCIRISLLYISSYGMYYYRQRVGSYTYHYSFNKHIDMFNAHYAIYQMFAYFPDLFSEKVIAFTRMFRRLIQAKKDNPAGNIIEQQKQLSKMFPTWKEIIVSIGSEKLFLGMAKLLGIRNFMKLDILWLNYLKR